MEPRTITLKSSIEAHGEQVTELTLTEPDLGALDGVDIAITEGALKFNLGDMRKIFAAMAGIPPSAAGKIKLGDVRQVVEVVLDFLDISLPTGES